MTNADRIAWCDEQIQKSIQAYDNDAYSEKELPRLSDAQAVDIMARMTTLGTRKFGLEGQPTLNSVQMSTVVMVTLARTGRNREEFV